MNLSDRISRLEARLRPAVVVPVLLDECHLFENRVGLRTILRSQDGSTWVQRADEEYDAFKGRVTAEARRGIRIAEGATSIRLVVLRPKLTREEWMDLYSSPGISNEPGVLA